MESDDDKQALFAALHRRVNQFATASHFFWGFWAIIQARHSPIDFDFMGYALDRFWGYYKHKAAFFPAAFTASDQAALDTIVAAKAANEAAVKAEDDQAKQLAGGVYQSCGISCDVTEDADACAAFQRVTEVICDQEGKEACQELCDEGKGNEQNPEKNEHACAKVASME